MLKIKAPIETKVKADLCGSYESFTERIRGNYLQMEHMLSGADLLHLVTEPPEIFLMEGGDTLLENQTNVENRQINKVEIVNNLVNRILFSADGSLTYQDRVYITNILHQMGIRDDRRFMTEVRKAFQETKERNELINLYWNHMNELRTMVSEYQEQNHTELRDESTVLREEVLHLHEEVNRRLQTGAIYQMLRSFSAVSYNPRHITEQQYLLSEQGRLSSEILLQRLRETVRGERQPLVYRHENVYEGSDIENNEITLESVNERVNSAVLLNLVDNLYQSSYEYIDHKLDNWYRTADTYYQSAGNTLSRIENNTAYIDYLRSESTRIEEERREERNEFSILNQILDLRRWQDIRLQPSVGGNLYETKASMVTLGSTENVTEGDSFESTELTHIENSENVTVSEETLRKEEQNLEQKLYQTYQQNVARNEQYMTNLREVMERFSAPPRETVSRERMRRETLSALEHPEEFLDSMHRQVEKEEERREAFQQAVESALPREQQLVHRLLREYIEAPEEKKERMGISVNNQSILLYDIYQQLTESERQQLILRENRTGEEEEALRDVLEASEGRRETGEEGERVKDIVREIREREEELREGRTLTEEETALIHKVREREENREILRQIESRVIERWQGDATRRREIPTATEEREALSFIHKSVETEVSEEVLEELREEMQRTRDTVRKTAAETVTNENRSMTTVNNVEHTVMEQNDEEIQRLVNRTVRRQLDTITEKVYGRIEKQLNNERRRRGL